MKPLPLSTSIIAALMLTVSGESSPALLSKISTKEKELARVTLELSNLKKQLAAPAKTSAHTYTVKPGDTLSKIARQHNVTYSQLLKWNKISDPSRIGIGQELIINEASSAQPVAKKNTSAPSSKPAAKSPYYSVSRGDTFYGIARKNSISLNQLTQLNPGVDPSRIFSGQKLKVSGSPAKPIRQASAPTRKSIAKAAPKAPAPAKAKAKTTASAPKKSSTTALTRSSTSKKPSTAPTSSRKKSAPKPVVKKEVKSASAPTPPKVEESMPTAAKSVSSVILTNETTFSEFASKHRTSTAQLNALNGWNLPQATVLARGSEIYVPK